MGNGMGKLGVFAFCLMFFVLSAGVISARMIISEPEDVYSLGDKLYVSVDGIRGSETGNLNINLECGNNAVNLLKISSRAFSPEGGQSYSLPYKILSKEDLEINSLEDIVGTCRIAVSVGSEQAFTNNFQISKEIIIDSIFDKDGYDPGEAITLTIEATKANKDLVEGFAEASGAINFSRDVEKGVITETFSMPGDSESGDYVLNVYVYDEGENGEVLNEGRKEISFKINQIVSYIETSLSALKITPEEKLTISADVYDQSGKIMPGSVSVLLISPKGNEIQKTVESGEFVLFDFPSNAAAGRWKIFSSFDDVAEESAFEMLEFQKVEFEFQDSILFVRNVGNVRYNKTIDVDIGGTIKKINLNMKVGAEKKFNLKAPDGNYDISVGDGSIVTKTNVALVGSAISIDDLENVGIFRGYSILWVFLIIILLGIGIVLILRYGKKTIRLGSKMKKIKNIPERVRGRIEKKMPRNYASNVSNTLQLTNKSPAAQSLDENEEREHGMIDLTQTKVGKAESSLVLKGERGASAVVSLHVKNYGSLGKDGKQRLAGIVAGVKEKKGLVDWKGEYIFIVFSPLATKTFKNELLASKAGFDIFEKITSQNKKFKDKIDFNIGINSGDLVASKEGGKLKYTSIGNTIALAKRIADSSNNKLLVSDAVHKKLIRILKGEKIGEIAKSSVWEISRIVDTGANADKLKEILKRMEHG